MGSYKLLLEVAVQLTKQDKTINYKKNVKLKLHILIINKTRKYKTGVKWIATQHYFVIFSMMPDQYLEVIGG